MDDNVTQFDTMLMGELLRLSLALEALGSEILSFSIIQQISALMSPIFGTNADFSGVTKILRKIKAKNMKGLSTSISSHAWCTMNTNSVSITRAYSAMSARKVSKVSSFIILFLSLTM